ncbi:TPA: hypothetical protein N0F65_011815, partial [Lagenidium giganteum]
MSTSWATSAVPASSVAALRSSLTSAMATVAGAAAMAGAVHEVDDSPFDVPATAFDSLVPVSGNGVNTFIRDAFLFLDRYELVFAMGKFVGIQNIQNQDVTFLSTGPTPNTAPAPAPTAATGSAAAQTSAKHDALGDVTALALSGKRQYLAVCRAAVSDRAGASVCIYAFRTPTSATSATATTGLAAISDADHAGHFRPKARKPRTRVGTHQKTLYYDTERFSCAALSPDGKLVCCQSTTANWSVVIWDWGRGRQVAATDVHCKVTRVRFNSIDMAQLSTSGGNLLRLWTLSEYSLKVFGSFKSGDETKAKHVASYVDHVWLPDDCLVALLDDGDVQLIVNAELIQTVRSVHNQFKLTSLDAHAGTESVVLAGDHGFVSVLRVGTKMMKTNEKEMHVQRRMRVHSTQTMYSIACDPTGSSVLCCTEHGYGSYDLSNLCLLRGDDEVVTLNALCSTPLSAHMDRLSAAVRRPCIAAACKLRSGDHALQVWNQLDCHECFISHTLEGQPTPQSIDLHPAGSELLVAFPSKIQEFFVLQDSLRLAFELMIKQVTLVQYSPSGSCFAGIQGANKTILIYLNLSRRQREPQLIGVVRGFRDTIVRFSWSFGDLSFFAADMAGELKQFSVAHSHHSDQDDTVRSALRSEVDEQYALRSMVRVLHKHHVTAALTAAALDRDCHDYVLFGIEKMVATTHGTTGATTSSSGDATDNSTALGANSSRLRAWVNGDLAHDALFSKHGTVIGDVLPHNVTALERGPIGTLFAGTASGAVLLLYWRVAAKRSANLKPLLQLCSVVRRIDLHTAPIAGLYFHVDALMLYSNAESGEVLACRARRLVLEHANANMNNVERLRLLATLMDPDLDHDFGHGGSSTQANGGIHRFQAICQPDEVALFDRNGVELRKLKLLDLETELQQLKLENEMLSKQAMEQRQRHESTLAQELSKHRDVALQQQRQLRATLEDKLAHAALAKDASEQELSLNARLAQDQYLRSMDKLTTESERLKTQLEQERIQAHDAALAAEEALAVQARQAARELAIVKESAAVTQEKLRAELDATHKQLREAKAAEQMTNAHGTVAALHQEVKMLLSALHQKDHELQVLRGDHEQQEEQIDVLMAQLARERDTVERVQSEKNELLKSLAEHKAAHANITRLNHVHRSQIELLQKHLLPKERELEQIQGYMNELHGANQEVVVQANLSDRLRADVAAKAKRLEKDVGAAHRRLGKVRDCLLVLQEELGELVKRSAVQEKSALVHDIVRVHKQLTRQLALLEGKDDGQDELSAELHRQNSFLLRNKEHMRRQMELVHQDKHKLATALSFQNASLMRELNALRRQHRELERRLKHMNTEAEDDNGDDASDDGELNTRANDDEGAGESENNNDDVGLQRPEKPHQIPVVARVPTIVGLSTKDSEIERN